MSCATYRLQPASRKGPRRTNPRPGPIARAPLPPRASSLPPVEAWFQTPEPTWGEACDRRARAAIRSLLAGRPRLQPIRFDTYAEWTSVITIMAAAYSSYGDEGARFIFTTLAANHPQLAALQAGGPGDQPTLPRSPGAPSPRCANGGELLYGILPIGVTLLTGRPDAGTTWLALQWALAIARAHTLPDTTTATTATTTAPRSVLYLALDDGAGAIARRLALLQPPAGLRLAVVDRPPASLRAGLMDLCAQMPTLDLVVIDSLTTFLGPDPSAAAVHDALARLHLLAMAGRSAILLVDHHTYPLGLDVPTVADLDATLAASPNLDANPDTRLDGALDNIVAGLHAADAACQIETVYRLSRPPGADGTRQRPPGRPHRPRLAHPPHPPPPPRPQRRPRPQGRP